MLRLFGKPKPDSVVAELQRLVPAALGDRLLSLILYGPHAADDSQGDVDSAIPVSVLVVLRTLDQQALDDLASAFEQAPSKSSVSTMALSVEELLASTDVFPITFMEMQRRYRVLAGEDVLVDLPISDVHLRLRCEQELKNLVLRMQSAFLLERRKPRRLRASLRRSYSAFVRAARASLTLVGQETPRQDEQILAAAAALFKLDEHVLRRVVEVCRTGASLGRDALVAVYASFLVAVHRAAEVIDQLPDDVAVLETAKDSAEGPE